MSKFPTGYTDKGSTDSTDKIWASDGVTNFNITVDEIGDENFSNRNTDNLTEGSTNLYYTDSRVDANTTVVSKADKTNVLELDNTTVYTPTADYHPATKKYIDDIPYPIATETTAGIVEIATDSEVKTGTDTEKSITPKTLSDNFMSIDTYLGITAGSTYLYADISDDADTGGVTTYFKAKEVLMNNDGVYYIEFQLRTDNASYPIYGQIYKNGVAYGTERSTTASNSYFSENLTFEDGDLCQIYIKAPNGNSGYTSKLFNAYIKYTRKLQALPIPSGTINLN